MTTNPNTTVTCLLLDCPERTGGQCNWEEGDYLDRFDKVAKGLELEHLIANKIANFIHYEVQTAKKIAKAQGRAEALSSPMGVSQWAEYGKQFGYWDYFEKEIRAKALSKEYQHSFSEGLARSFHLFAQKYLQERRSVHLIKDVQLNHNQACNFQKLKYFNLVLKDEHKRGHWLLTQRGVGFLYGRFTIPESVITRDDRVIDKLGSIHISQHPEIGTYWQQQFDLMPVDSAVPKMI